MTTPESFAATPASNDQFAGGYPRVDAELLAWREIEWRWHLEHRERASTFPRSASRSASGARVGRGLAPSSSLASRPRQKTPWRDRPHRVHRPRPRRNPVSPTASRVRPCGRSPMMRTVGRMAAVRAAVRPSAPTRGEAIPGPVRTQIVRPNPRPKKPRRVAGGHGYDRGSRSSPAPDAARSSTPGQFHENRSDIGAALDELAMWVAVFKRAR